MWVVSVAAFSVPVTIHMCGMNLCDGGQKFERGQVAARVQHRHPHPPGDVHGGVCLVLL